MNPKRNGLLSKTRFLAGLKAVASWEERGETDRLRRLPAAGAAPAQSGHEQGQGQARFKRRVLAELTTLRAVGKIANNEGAPALRVQAELRRRRDDRDGDLGGTQAAGWKRTSL